MDRPRLRARLAREAREYLAELRELREALKRAEGWVTLGLILAVIIMLVVWFITALGFDRLNQVVSSLGQSRGRICRPLGDFAAIAIVIDAVAMFMLAVLALGEMMRLLDRLRDGRPKDARQVAIPAAFMLLTGTAGIVFMRLIC